MSSVKYDKSKGKIIREGEYNKNKIFEIIARHRKGLSFKQLQNYLKNSGNNVSRPTIYSHLDELERDKKVFQNKKYGKYFLADWQLGDIHNFAKSMKDGCEQMIKKSLIDRSAGDKIPGQYTIAAPGAFYTEFFKALSGISASNQFCDTKFDKNTLDEKYIFEFGNRIGAYITYLLIESMRPASRVSKRRRNVLSSTLLHKAIEIESIARCFHNLLNSFSSRLENTSRIKNPTVNFDHHRYYELNKNDFDRLSRVFRNVYPGIYEALEKKWEYDVSSETDWLEHNEREGSIKCTHKWEETSIYKLGKFHFCTRCYDFISDNSMKIREGIA
jgi:hypothetical protein